MGHEEEEAPAELPFMPGDEFCISKHPGRPVLGGQECVSCARAYEEYPYQDEKNCVAARPNNSFYIAGVVLLEVAFVAVSILTLVALYIQKKNTREFTALHIVLLTLVCACVPAVAVLGGFLAFAKPLSQMFWCMLWSTLGCLLLGSFLVGCLVWVAKDPEEDEEELQSISDANEDVSCFVGKCIVSAVIQFAGLASTVLFVAAGIVQFLDWIEYDLPDSEPNRVLKTIGSDVGTYALIPILISIACNLIFNNQLVCKRFDAPRQSWAVVGLQLLYMIIEAVGYYAALCLGNMSMVLFNDNPTFAVVFGLMICQLYGSDLWTVLANNAILGYHIGEEVPEWGPYVIESIFVCIIGAITENSVDFCECTSFPFVLLGGLIGLPVIILLICSEIVPTIADSFALPFQFFFSMIGINIGMKQFYPANDEPYESDKDVADTYDLADMSSVWNHGNAIEIIHYFARLAFSVGLFLLLLSAQIMKGSGGNLTTALELCVLILVGGGACVVIAQLFGLKLLVTHLRSWSPRCEKGVNTLYLRGRTANRYAMVPLAGPLMCATSAFLGRHPLNVSAEHAHWGAYALNFATFASLVAAALCYELGRGAWTVPLAAVFGLFAICRVALDVAAVFKLGLRISFEKCAHACSRCRRRAPRSGYESYTNPHPDAGTVVLERGETGLPE